MKQLAALFFALLLTPSMSLAVPLAFVLDAPEYRLEEAQIIARQLRELGIEVIVEEWGRTELHQAMRAGKRTASLTDWGSSFFDPFDLAVPKLGTRARGNYSFFANARLDRLFGIASTALDTAFSREAYKTAQRIIFRQSPWVFGYSRPVLTALNPNVKGLVVGMDSRINLHDVRLGGDGDMLALDMATTGFITLDPAMHRDRATETVLRNMFDALVTRTAEGVVVPEIAESWRREGDLVWDFTLRDGVTFHDGTPLTAEDVVFTFQRILNPNSSAITSPRKGLLGPLTSVQALDNGTVRFSLSRPFPVFLQALVHFQIVPKSYVLRVGAETFAREPMGCGPFRYVGGDVHGGVTMQRYSKYYGGAPDLEPVALAWIDIVRFRPVPRLEERIENLTSGASHVIQAVPESARSTLRGLGMKVQDTQGTRSYQIELNNQRPPFNDIRVRRALNLAIDWEEVFSEAYDGRATRLATCFLPSGFGYDPSLAPVAQNLPMARLLLRQAGYEVMPSKGYE